MKFLKLYENINSIDPFDEEDWDEIDIDENIKKIPIIRKIVIEMIENDINYEFHEHFNSIDGLTFKIPTVQTNVGFNGLYEGMGPYVKLYYSKSRHIEIYPFYRNDKLQLFIYFSFNVVDNIIWYDITQRFDENTKKMIKFLTGGIRSKFKTTFDIKGPISKTVKIIRKRHNFKNYENFDFNDDDFDFEEDENEDFEVGDIVYLPMGNEDIITKTHSRMPGARGIIRGNVNGAYEKKTYSWTSGKYQISEIITRNDGVKVFRTRSRWPFHEFTNWKKLY